MGKPCSVVVTTHNCLDLYTTLSSAVMQRAEEQRRAEIVQFELGNFAALSDCLALLFKL
jgi:hypothetical protein